MLAEVPSDKVTEKLQVPASTVSSSQNLMIATLISGSQLAKAYVFARSTLTLISSPSSSK